MGRADWDDVVLSDYERTTIAAIQASMYRDESPFGFASLSARPRLTGAAWARGFVAGVSVLLVVAVLLVLSSGARA